MRSRGDRALARIVLAAVLLGAPAVRAAGMQRESERANDGVPSPVEIARARDIVRADPNLGAERTIKTLRTSEARALRQSAELGDGITMTAEEVARLPLISHLEMHMDELERLLGAEDVVTAG